MKSMNKRRTFNIIVRWLPAVVTMAAIFYMSHQPATTLAKMLPYFNKVFPQMQSFNWGHFVAYFVLGIAIYWGLVGKTRPLTGKIMTVVICTLYGVTDEVHQLFVAGRHFDVVDIRNDAIGASLAMLIISIPPLSRLFIKLSNHCEK